jgi:predicted PurR-regulated permease PerM
MADLSSDDAGASRTTGRLDIRAVAVTIIVAAGTLYGMHVGAPLLAPVLVSALLAYAIEPFVRTIGRSGLPHSLAVLVASALLIAAVVVAGAFARRQLIAFVDSLPAAVRDLQISLARARRDAAPGVGSPIEHLQVAATEINATLDGTAPRPAPGIARVIRVSAPFDVRTQIGDLSIAAVTASAQLLAIGLLTLFLLLGGEALKRKVIAIAGPRAQQKVTHDIIKAIDRQIERYLFARLLISALVAGATWLGLWCLGVRQPLVLGLFAGVLNVVPFIGPAVAVALIGLVAFLQFHTIEATASAIVVTGTIAALEGNFISPWLTSRAGELNTVAVFVSVLFWGWMWDVWGLVLAIPIMVAIKAAADHIDPLQPLGELLGR